jgi:hypothetical protein
MQQLSALFTQDQVSMRDETRMLTAGMLSNPGE